MITPKDFCQTNQLLARLIYDPDTPEPMREAAKKARRALFRYRDGTTKPAPAHKCAD